MRHWNGRQGLLRFIGLLMLVFSLALMSCDNTGTNTATVDGTVGLTATNAAALGGLTFPFADATLFGFPGQSTTLALGTDGTTFTLTPSGGTVISGTSTFGSCNLTQNLAPLGSGEAPFAAVYGTCQVTGRSDGDIGFGGSGNGTITLRLGKTSATSFDSNPVRVLFLIDIGGRITISQNLTPIGVIG